MGRAPFIASAAAAALSISLAGIPSSIGNSPVVEQRAAKIHYTYDALGRLKTVTDTNGESATYTYDPVGDVTRITRTSAPAAESAPPPPAPDLAPPRITTVVVTDSATLTITGSGFSSVAGETVVRIGGLYAHVLSAASELLRVEIPAELKSNDVEVQTPGGTDDSRADLPAARFAVDAVPPADPPWTPLLAPTPDTAVSGRTMSTEGRPLAGATVAIDDATTLTDENGRFVLPTVPGHHEVRVDAENSPSGNYGIFELGVDAVAGRTTVLPTTTWLPKIDLEHGTTIPAITDREYVVTSPAIPGLEVHVPKGTSIVDDEGRPVRRLSITQIPYDRQPFRGAPGMPLAWTLQPGGATVRGEGLAVVYPNLTHAPPGGTVDYVDHDADRPGMGWAVYGAGTVTNDGRAVMPDDATRLHETYPLSVSYRIPCLLIPVFRIFCPKDHSHDGDPVNLQTGLLVLEKTDMAIPDVLSAPLIRTYRQNDPTIRSFGVGQTDSFDIFIAPDGAGNYLLGLPDGGSITFTPGEGGVYHAVETPSMFAGATLTSSSYRDFVVALRDGTIYTFGSYFASLVAITDRFGNTLSLTRDAGGYLRQITTPNGRWITVDWGGCASVQCVAAIHDNAGRTVSYQYDENARLSQVTDPADQVAKYTWMPCDGDSHCTEIERLTDPRGIDYLINHYDDAGRIDLQTLPDGGTYQFFYTVGETGVTSTLVFDPRGVVRRADFDENGYAVENVAALGQPQEQKTVYERLDSGQIASVVDPLGRRTEYTYNTLGDVTKVLQDAGTDDAVSVQYGYEPRFDRVSSITNALNKKTTITYSDRGVGGSISTKDPLGHTSVVRTLHGQVVSMADALGHTSYVSYLHGDVVAVADPDGHVTSLYHDSLGRTLRATDAAGGATINTYDLLSRVVTTTDALGGVIKQIYDPNNNLTSLTDARDDETTWTYDVMDRASIETDPLSRERSWTYDPVGNVATYTDGNSVTAEFKYDPLSRMETASYGSSHTPEAADKSTITYTYDDGNRLRKMVDTTSGTITCDYDDFDQLTRQVSPQGTVSYTYDDGGRRHSMQIGAAPVTTYGYDAANQLKTITQSGRTVAIGYDAAGRRTSVELPDKSRQKYTLDDSGNITHISYQANDRRIGDLSYKYNVLGLRTEMSGSLARTMLPPALSNATYDTANQLMSADGTSFTYDDDGQLLKAGGTVYAWNTRHQLVKISDGSSTTLEAYDSYGRRTRQTSEQSDMSMLYDGPNVVRETSDAGDVSLLTGLRLDETFERVDSGGTHGFLTDAVGSTLALTGSDGKIDTSYTYAPSGATKSSGVDSANDIEFTGRENVGHGLYFNRARYYDTTTGRFISRDPLGIYGLEPNPYAYASDSPVNYTDPLGTTSTAQSFDENPDFLSNKVADSRLGELDFPWQWIFDLIFRLLHQHDHDPYGGPDPGDGGWDVVPGGGGGGGGLSTPAGGGGGSGSSYPMSPPGHGVQDATGVGVEITGIGIDVIGRNPLGVGNAFTLALDSFFVEWGRDMLECVNHQIATAGSPNFREKNCL